MKKIKQILIILGVLIFLVSIALNVYFIVTLQNKPKKDSVGTLGSKEPLVFTCKKLLLSNASTDAPGARKIYMISRNGKTAYLQTQACLYPNKDYSINHTLLTSPLMYFDTRMILVGVLPNDWEASWNKEKK